MCEALLKRSLSGLPETLFTIASAGLHAVVGKEADPRARLAAEEFGVSLGEHRAKLITQKMVEEADTIFGMDSTNYVELLSLFPCARKKTYMLSAYSGTSDTDIPDPYLGDDAELRRCYTVLELCIRNLAADLSTSVVPDTPQTKI